MLARYKEGQEVVVNELILRHTKVIKPWETVKIIDVDPTDFDLTYYIRGKQGYRYWVSGNCLVNPIGIKI